MTAPRSDQPEQPENQLLAGGGELGALMRAFGWTSNPLGPTEHWPQALKTCVRIMLTSRQPIWIGWGDDLTFLYNDPYKAIIGGKHPWALGQPTSVVWREIWDVIGPMLSFALRGDEGTYVEAQRLIMERYGYEEETYYTFSYSPVPNEQGGTGGIICANTDDTRRVIGERQMALLTELASRTADARTVEAACTLSAAALATDPYDLPFALLYLLNADSESAVLASHVRLAPGHPAAPSTVQLDAESLWPLREVLREHEMRVVELDSSFGTLPAGAWHRPPRRAAVLPIAPSSKTAHAGLFVVGLNPFRRLDADYTGFLGLVAGQISASIANAEAHEEEKERAEALAELDRAKTQFFSNVSHEFRTPLTLLLGPADDALAEPDILPANRQRVEVIHRNALRLQKLVNTLLDFSRIEAGRIQASFVPTDLAAYTADLASTFRSAVERAGLSFVVEAPPLPEAVYVDADMWEKVVLNLLSNALKHTFAGSITVRVRQEDGRVAVEIEDTGVGIPVEELPHLFERFHRVPNAQSRTHEGSGIGLAFVQELVKQHGGAIEVRSTVGSGTTFRITLPLGSAHIPPEHVASAPRDLRTSASSAAYVEEALRWLPGSEAEQSYHRSTWPAPDHPIPRLPTDGARIIVADDNADMRDYVSRLLSERGWAVTAMPNGRAALDAARENRPDLVLTDVMMPELDGFALLRELRADPCMHRVPVILLSARAGEEARVEGMQAGADDYLVKPFAARELVARVAAQLQRAHGAAVADGERARLRELFTQAPAAVAVLRGPEHVYEIANERYLDLVGRRDILGKPVREALPELAGQGLYELLDRVYQTGEAFNSPELAVMLDSRASGQPEQRFFDFVYQPIREADGAVSGVFVHCIDITDQVRTRQDVEEKATALEQAQAELAMANEELMQQVDEAERAKANAEEAQREAECAQQQAIAANAAKSEFLAAMSHELRTPLNAIAGYLQLIELGVHGPVTEEQRLALARARRSEEHLLSLINDVLNFVKLEAGHVEYRLEDISLEAAMADVTTMIEPQLAAKKIRYEVSLDPSLIVHADGEKLRQILLNLLSNARKFTESGGLVTVEATRDADRCGIVSLHVSDTGCGIAADKLEAIFDPFVQVNRKLTHTEEGTGLGLAISRDLAHAMGGDIVVESVVGKGSRFTLTLPSSPAF